MPASASWSRARTATTRWRAKSACAATSRGRISCCFSKKPRARCAPASPPRTRKPRRRSTASWPKWSAACATRSAIPRRPLPRPTRQRRIRRIGEAEIYQYARDRKFEETAIALSLLCDTPIDVVERALLDPGAEIVLILAKVAGLSSTTTKAILLLRAADRGMSAKDLDQALTSFNRLQPDT